MNRRPQEHFRKEAAEGKPPINEGGCVDNRWSCQPIHHLQKVRASVGVVNDLLFFHTAAMKKGVPSDPLIATHDPFTGTTK